MSLKFHEMTIDAYLSALGSTAPAKKNWKQLLKNRQKHLTGWQTL